MHLEKRVEDVRDAQSEIGINLAKEEIQMQDPTKMSEYTVPGKADPQNSAQIPAASKRNEFKKKYSSLLDAI